MMNEAQKWDAAQVVTDWCHRHGYDPMDIYEAQSLLAALDEAGYVVVDRDRWERVVHHADLAFEHFPVLQDAGVFPDRSKRLQPGDLDPLPTQEGT